MNFNKQHCSVAQHREEEEEEEDGTQDSRRRWLNMMMTAADGFSDRPGVKVRPVPGLHGIDYLAESVVAKKVSDETKQSERERE